MSEQFGIQTEEDNLISDFAADENIKTAELRDWQARAMNYYFSNVINDKCKILFEASTGVGKTRLGIEIMKKLWESNPDYHVLIVVPKNVILETGWYKELYDAGIGIQDIGVYYGKIKEYAKVTITNMQNIQNIATDIFDVVCWDEVHNYCTEKLFKFLELESFKHMIGLSATMERMDNKHWKLFKLFNYNIFKYSPKQALLEGVLNPFRFVNIGVVMDYDTRERYEKLTEDINMIMVSGGGFGKIMRSASGLKYKLLSLMTERKKLVNNYKRKFEVTRQLCKKHANDKIIVFNEFNEQTNKFYWELLESGVKCCVFHSGIPNEKRMDNLSAFKKGKYNCILTSKVLDEGFNLPSLDVAIICAGNSTSRQTVQRMGRVLRRKENDSMLYQIYVVDSIEEDQSIKRAKTFKDLCSDYREYTFGYGEVINFDK